MSSDSEEENFDFEIDEVAENPPENLSEPFITFKCIRLVHQNKNVERGGKMLLPEWMIHELARTELSLPFSFRITNPNNGRFTHAGVLEFSIQDDDRVHIPRWLMEFLGLEEGCEVQITTNSLPTATYCKLQPLTNNCAYISNTKLVLEKNLQYFACLTEGDIIAVHEINKNQIYKMKVTKTLPESAVNILLDCEVELDFDTPQKRQFEKTQETKNLKGKSVKLFQGQGYKLNGTEKNGSEVNDENESINKIEKEESLEGKSTIGFVSGKDCFLMENKSKRKKNQKPVGPPSKRQRMDHKCSSGYTSNNENQDRINENGENSYHGKRQSDEEEDL